MHRHAHATLQLGLQLLDVLALLADHDARTGAVNRDASVLGRTLDDDPSNRRVRQFFLQVFTHIDIFLEHLGEGFAVCIPARTPVTRD